MLARSNIQGHRSGWVTAYVYPPESKPVRIRITPEKREAPVEVDPLVTAYRTSTELFMENNSEEGP